MEQVENIRIGKMIRSWRKQNDLSVKEVADEFQISSFSLYGYESGKTALPLWVIKKYVKKMGTTYEYFLHGNSIFKNASDSGYIRSLIPDWIINKRPEDIFYLYRNFLNLSQPQMGEKLGCSHSLVNKCEQNTHVSLLVICRYAKASGFPIDLFINALK